MHIKENRLDGHSNIASVCAKKDLVLKYQNTMSNLTWKYSNHILILCALSLAVLNIAFS